MDTRLTTESSIEVVDAAIHQVLSSSDLSLGAKGLFTLLAEHAGSPLNLFDGLVEKAEVVHSAVEELIAAGLVIRV